MPRQPYTLEPDDHQPADLRDHIRTWGALEDGIYVDIYDGFVDGWQPVAIDAGVPMAALRRLARIPHDMDEPKADEMLRRRCELAQRLVAQMDNTTAADRLFYATWYNAWLKGGTLPHRQRKAPAKARPVTSSSARRSPR